MKRFNLEEAKMPGTRFCTRCYGFKAEILSFDDKTLDTDSCKRPIKYKIFYPSGDEEIMLCDINGRCNSNKYIINDSTHDLMIDDSEYETEETQD
jgi:hypothetical protein